MDMASKKEIRDHLKSALKEIGDIKPWFDEELEDWTFSHPAYPVEYGGKTREDVIENYPKYLEEFIKQRLSNNLSEQVEKRTKGKGGFRLGSGRPKGSKRAEPTKQVRVPEDIAQWIKQPGMIEIIRKMMNGYGKSHRK